MTVTHREFAEQHWELARVCFNSRRTNFGNDAYWWVVANGSGPLCDSVFASESEAWAHLAEFTRDRLEELRQLEKQWCLIGAQAVEWWSFMEREEEWTNRRSFWARGFVQFQFVLSRLQRELDKLRKGMK